MSYYVWIKLKIRVKMTLIHTKKTGGSVGKGRNKRKKRWGIK
jgi:hypothetical protein